MLIAGQIAAEVFELLPEPKAGGAVRHRLATSEKPQVREVAMSGGAFEFLHAT
jgi:hypothetical protein